MTYTSKRHPVRKLIAYMKYRAKSEGTLWEMTDDYMAAYFNVGVRQFFKVLVADDGTLICDVENPVAFESYRCGDR
jgi:hypothetical protein